MKIEMYFPHDVNALNYREMISLIEAENASGYGVYWAILEYLRTQEGYEGDVRAIRGIARRVGARLDKATRVLNDYGLFVIEGGTFYSPILKEMMQPLEEKRARKRGEQKTEMMSQAGKGVSVNAENVHQLDSNELKTNEKSLKEKNSKLKKEISYKEKADVAVSLDWERHVDGLASEQPWIEIMATRSGLGKTFVRRFGEVLQHFKLHVQAVGKEKDIQTPTDAKRYFCFFLEPGSVTFKRLVAELQKPVDKGMYKFEDRDPVTGQRSYCGVPIPDEAPPRPNTQAVWSDGKWRF